MMQTAKTRKHGAGFDIDRHVVLLMGLMVYPFISMELAQNLTGRSYDRQMLDGFRDDALKLFMKGVAAKQER